MYADLILVFVCVGWWTKIHQPQNQFSLLLFFNIIFSCALPVDVPVFFCSSQNYSHVSISDVDWYWAFSKILISILADYDVRSFSIDIVQVRQNLIMLSLSFSQWNSIPKGCVKLLTTQINVNVSSSLFGATLCQAIHSAFHSCFCDFICSMKVLRYLLAIKQIYIRLWY